MKKLFFAMLALCVAAVSFTSCEKQADPATQPIAGKTYQYTEVSGDYFKVRFNNNFTCYQEVKADGDVIGNNNFVWAMNDGKNFTIRYAQGVINLVTGEDVSGKLVYNGVFDATAKTVTLTNVDNPHIVYVCAEVK